MRRTIMIGAAAAALALAASAPAHSASNKFVTLHEGPSAASGGREQHIELLSYSFGDGSGVSKVDGFTAKQPVRPYRPTQKDEMMKSWTVGDAPPPPRPGGVTVAGGDINNSRVPVGGGVNVAGADLGGDNGRISPGPGTLTVRGSFPGCKVGKRYPRAEMGDGSVRFVIDNIIVTSCGSGGATLEYSKVRVRGWDPEKKEL
jgi:hypothetical protein